MGRDRKSAWERTGERKKVVIIGRVERVEYSRDRGGKRERKQSNGKRKGRDNGEREDEEREGEGNRERGEREWERKCGKRSVPEGVNEG